jgi:hypothetical protein
MTKSLSGRHAGNSGGVFRISLSLVASAFIATYSLASDDSGELPKRYSQLGLEAVEEVLNFRYRKFRNADKQSIIVRNSARDSYLIVFVQPIPLRNSAVVINDRNLRSGNTRVCLGEKQQTNISGRSRGVGGGFFSNSRNCKLRIQTIYPLENMKQENEVVKFLREND